jgi:hypothetical protein
MYARLGATAAAAIAVVAVALWQLSSIGPAHPGPSPTPQPSISSTPSAAPRYTAPPLTGTYTSSIFGLSLGSPAGWSTSASRTPWTLDNGAYREPVGDYLMDPVRENLYLKVASLPLGSVTLEQFAAMAFAGRNCSGPGAPITIDGAPGIVNSADNCLTAVVVLDGRGYLIGGHWDNNLAELRSIDWSGWFMDVVATVHLDPAGAVDHTN